MGGGSDTTRRHGELAGIGLGIGDELGDRLRWNREVRYHWVGHTGDAGNRRDVAAEIETKLFVQRSIDRVCRSDEEERIAVRERAHDRLGGNIAGSTWPALDDEWLAEPLRQPLTHRTRDDVGRSAERKPNNPAHWPRRIGLRPRDPRYGRQRGRARGQMQKLSAGKFHAGPSRDQRVAIEKACRS